MKNCPVQYCLNAANELFAGGLIVVGALLTAYAGGPTPPDSVSQGAVESQTRGALAQHSQSAPATANPDTDSNSDSDTHSNASSAVNKDGGGAEARPIDPKRSVEAFDFVWTMVRDKYWDPEMKGLNWEAVRDELRPKAETIDNTVELDRLLDEMLGRLKRSHYGIIPEQAYQGLANGTESDTSESSSTAGTIGVELRWVDGQAVVWKAIQDSHAVQAGIRAGWVLIERQNQSIDALLTQTASAAQNSLIDSALLQRLIVRGLTDGRLGSTASFVWLDQDQQRVVTELEYQRPRGRETRFGNLPATYVDCESRVVDGNIPMFSLNIFFEAPMVLEQFEKLLSEHRDAPGLILDLRGNPGGLGFMAMSFGGWFTERSGLHLGTMITRSGSMRLSLLPRPEPFLGKVAVLVDEYSMSTSEILAGGLQDNGLARIFGRKTPGMALPSAIEKLPHGAGFQYAFANYESADGETLEGHGVEPDQMIELSRAQLLTGEDPDIAAAIQWIRNATRETQP